ncbi:GNAT family N-acetyltransferase [Nonlabens sp.]|mgnify:CR=1 FL=1|uniref:GNAT family N-acetyltransferase n=1 Tax=Nonlabens sp. TaxID=1888209 RepID=UPI003F6A2E28
MNIEIRSISALETYPVRHPILRAGRPIEECYFNGDELDTTVHLGVFINGTITAVASYLQHQDPTVEPLTSLKKEQCYQLRGMAVLQDMQGKQLGKKLLLHAEQLFMNKGVKALWFNARAIAIPFYEKMGYHKASGAFEITPIGTHYKMYKLL